MSEDFKDKETESGMVNEPILAANPLTELKEVDYTFGNHNFGYPRSLEELEAALDMADAQRTDPTQWVSSVDFHTRLETKYPWLR